MAVSEYAEMIEIPVSTCEMVTVQNKKRNFFKRRLIKNVNTGAQKKKTFKKTEISAPDTTPEVKTEKKFKFDLIGAQVAAIFILAVAILVTNIFWEDSGINTVLRSVFATEKVEKDEREYNVFNAFSPSKNQVALENGVMTVSGAGAIYSPVGGTVEKVEKSDDKFTVTVKHSDNFKTVISGADFIYCAEGELVYTSAPICYSTGGEVAVAMYGGDSLISGYTIADGLIVWQS